MTLTEVLIALLIIAVVGVPLVSLQVAGTRGLASSAVQEGAESVADAVFYRFARDRDGIAAFLAPAADQRSLGAQPWRWSPELTAGLDAQVLETWARDRALTIDVELSDSDLPGLKVVEVRAAWQEPGRPRQTLRRTQLQVSRAHS